LHSPNAALAFALTGKECTRALHSFTINQKVYFFPKLGSFDVKNINTIVGGNILMNGNGFDLKGSEMLLFSKLQLGENGGK
jgi:hypothetical protein